MGGAYASALHATPCFQQQKSEFACGGAKRRRVSGAGAELVRQGGAARLRTVRVRTAAAEEGGWDVAVSAHAEALMPTRRVGHHGAWSELSRALEVEREDLLEEVGAGVAFRAQERRGRLCRDRVLGLERHAPVRHRREEHCSSCHLGPSSHS